MEQIVPAPDQLSTTCQIWQRVECVLHTPAVRARYEALLFSAIATADPTHRRKVQLEPATRPEIIGGHSRETVTHRSVASLPPSVPFLRRSSPSLCHVTVSRFSITAAS